MMKNILILALLSVLVINDCIDYQRDSQYSTNLQVKITLDQIESFLNNGCQILIKTYMNQVIKNISFTDQKSGSESLNNITFIQLISKNKTVVRDNNDLKNNSIAVQLDQVVMKFKMTLNSKQQVNITTKSNFLVTFLPTTSPSSNWRLQIRMKQFKNNMKVSYMSSPLNNSTQTQLTQYLSTLINKRLAIQMMNYLEDINSQSSDLEQFFFVQKYDLGLAYNFTYQPYFSKNNTIMIFSLHGMVNHDYYFWLRNVPIPINGISKYALEANFLEIPGKNSTYALKYLINDRLANILLAAQYENNAHYQKMRGFMIDVFIKYLNLNLILNVNVLDRLFNTITKDTDNKQDKFDVSIKANNYPYLNFTSDNYVNLIVPVEIKFSLQKTKVARIDCNLQLNFLFAINTDKTDSNFQEVQQLQISILNINAFENLVNPQVFSQYDIEGIKRGFNAVLYLWSKGIQDAININDNGLELSQFFPQIKVPQLMASGQNMVMGNYTLLQLQKSQKQREVGDKRIVTSIDWTKIKATALTILSSVKSYIFG